MRFCNIKLLILAAIVLATSGCGSNDSSSNPGGKSEMDRMAELLEQESTGEPAVGNAASVPPAVKPTGERDYEEYMLGKYRDGVTPQNNAAVLFWQAMSPGELEPEDYGAICRELGVQQIDSAENTLKNVQSEPYRQRVLQWFRANGRPGATDKEAFGFIVYVTSRPWTSSTVPPLANWPQENQAALDMLIEAAKLPRFYLPSPSLLNEIDEALMERRMLGPQMARRAANDLAIRAMWNLGEGRPDDTWHDILAIYRLGRLVSQGYTIVEQLVGYAIDRYASDATLAILQHVKLSPDQAKAIHRDLSSLAEYSAMVDAIDIGERTSLEDITMRMKLGKKGHWLELLSVNESVLALARMPADWNVVIQQSNEFCDRIVAAVRMSPGPARAQAIEALNREISQMEAGVKRKLPSIGGMTEAERGELFASMLLALQLPNVDVALYAQDRTNTHLALSRLAAALAVYRAEHGRYPDSLDALVSEIIDKLPVDCFHQGPFVYRPAADGFTLYSFGPNGQDNSGLDAKEPVSANIPADADDIAIRLPLPKLELPKAK